MTEQELQSEYEIKTTDQTANITQEAPEHPTVDVDHVCVEEIIPPMPEHMDMDAQKWARAFNETAVRLGHSSMDEAWLLGWFANAIMSGYDAARAKYEPSTQQVDEEAIEAWINNAKKGYNE